MTPERDLLTLADRLNELAGMLRDPSVSEERAAELAAEAAELAAEAGREVEMERGSAAGEQPPGQEELL